MKRLLLIATALCMLGGVVLFQHRLLSIEGRSWSKESMSYLPSSDHIKPFLLGFESSFANYLWIKTELYFGGHLITDRDYPWLIKMLDIITRLNPHFYPAYEFAGLLVPDLCNDPQAARIILERGIAAIGDKKWTLAFYMGILYYKYYGDTYTAARYFTLAASVPSDFSARLTSLAYTFYNKSARLDEGYTYLQFLYQTSESPDVKKYLATKMNELHQVKQ